MDSDPLSTPRRYETVLTSVFSNDYDYNFDKENCDSASGKGAWANVDGTQFLFFDGSPDEPLPKMEIRDPHYLSKSIQTTGFFLVSLALFLCISTGLWVYRNRESRLVKAGQPEFMYLLCIGGCFVAASLLFLSFDESDGMSEKQLSSMCAAFPWFFVLGYLVMYSAVFSKLWRLSKLLQMRRRAVGIKQVLLPFTVSIFVTVLILVIWQAVDPLHWEREIITPDGELPLETFGECTSDHLIAFAAPIFGLFAIKMTMAAVVAWKMKDVQSELSESRWIFYGIFTHIQVWAVGIPIVVITDDVSKDAMYLMFAVLCFTFSTSLVALVVWPKLFVWIRDTYFEDSSGSSRDVKISIATPKRVSVSGLDNPLSSKFKSGVFSSTMGSEDTDKVAKLEREVAMLKAQLSEVSHEETGDVKEKDEKEAMEECYPERVDV